MTTQNMIEVPYSTTPTASTLAEWDTNKNLSANNHLEGYTTNVTSASLTTLTVGSTFQQYFTGTTTQSVMLPVTSTLVLGQSFYIANNSTGIVTVESSGSNIIQAMAANSTLLVTCILTTGTGVASWAIDYNLSPTLTTIDGDSGSAAPNSGTIVISGGPTGLTTVASGNEISLIGTAVVAHGGTAVTSVTVSPTASAWAGWDANKNLSANNHLEGYITTATAAGTTTLVVGSAYQQYFTGTTTQIVVLPVTSTLVLGQSFYIVNNSTGVVTVESSGANTIQAMASGSTLLVTCILTTGTTAASWNADYSISSALTLPLSIANGGTASTTASAARTALGITPANISSFATVHTQVFTSSGTYTPTTGMLYCVAEVQAPGGGSGGVVASTTGQACVSGGGGGGGYSRKTFSAATIGASQTVTIGAVGTAGANTGTSGGNGGTTSLGALLTATGGAGGNGSSSSSVAQQTNGGAGGVGASGDFNVNGGAGFQGITTAGLPNSIAMGGSSHFAGNTMGTFGDGIGNAGLNYGAGASGSQSSGTSGVAHVGATGGPGIVIITEYCDQ